MHVLIIGGGTGGMCLAHGLKQAGIPVSVYERVRTRSDGLHGYRVGIDPTGNQALQECLPQDLFETFIATCARAPEYLNVLTEKMKLTASIPLRGDDDPIESERSVSRMTLRQVLFTGMEDVLEFDKTFTHYEQDDGGVRAFFSDGTSATGDLLVAADGTNSAVRAQYLPHAGLKDTGIVAIAARSRSPIRRGRSCRSRSSTVCRSVRSPRAVRHLARDGVQVGHGRCAQGRHRRQRRRADQRWPGLLFDNTRDYVNWAIWAATDKYPPGLMDLRGAEIVSLGLEMTPDWHPNMRKLIELSDPGSAFSINIRTSEPIEPWPPTSVTLLGDAIHTMTPGQGVGANTALRDAALLCRRLAAADRGPRPCSRRSPATRPRWFPTASRESPTRWPKTVPTRRHGPQARDRACPAGVQPDVLPGGRQDPHGPQEVPRRPVLLSRCIDEPA